MNEIDQLDRLKELDIDTFNRLVILPIPPGKQSVAWFRGPEGDAKEIHPIKEEILFGQLPKNVAEAWIQHVIQEAIKERADPDVEKARETWGYRIEVSRGNDIEAHVWSDLNFNHQTALADSEAEAVLKAYIGVLETLADEKKISVADA